MVDFTTRPELQGSFGMVASTHYLASAAGMAVLEAGGNAVDAAVTAGFVLQVVEPHLNGPGGDMSLLFAPAGGPPQVLCGQGPAPAGATVDTFTALGVSEIPGSGPLAACIPGSTLAWFTLLRDHGTRDIGTVLRYAHHYAETGFPVLERISATIGAVEKLFAEEWTTSAAQYLIGGRPAAPGSWLKNPALAGTYQRLADAAAGKSREAGIDAAMDAWRTGFVADAIDRFRSTPWLDSTGSRHAGLLTGADLATWQPGYEDPAVTTYQGYTVAKIGPWGQGPVLLQQLAMLDRLTAADAPLGSADLVHAVVEVAKLALADRNAFYGDSAPVPLGTLLSASYADERWALVGDRASGQWRPGSPDGLTPRFPDHPDAAGPSASTSDRHAVLAGAAGEPTVPEASGRTRGDTCHIDVVDRWGNMVSATPSGGWLQSSPLIPELGFPLGTRMQMMTVQPGLPTTLMPGRRPRTTLSPTIVMAGDDPVLACGTPGGDQQDQWQVPFLIAVLRDKIGLQEAIDAPNFHTTHVASSFHPHEAHPGQMVIEDRIGGDVIDDLRGRGHDVQVPGPWTLGRLSAVARDPETGLMRAGANPRGMQGYAVGR